VGAGRLRDLGSRGAAVVRQAWLVWGLTLALFLVLEFGYRATHALRAGSRSVATAADSSQHPYAHVSWWPELQRDLRLRRNRFDPYRSHWSLPLASRLINIDSLGRRVTPQRPVNGPVRAVFLLGGSTAWGYTARDSMTIGAFLAEELWQRGIRDVEVVNLAQAAFNSTQEATTLLVELAHGRIPALAIFLDGYNDIATAAKYGEPAHTYGDEGIQQQLDRGRRSFGAELVGLGRHSALVLRLQRLLGRGVLPVRPPTTAAICGAVAGYYRNVSLIDDSFGRAFGFPVAHFLQPHPAVSGKPKTRWELGIPFMPQVPPCMAAIDSALQDRGGRSFFSLTDLFDADSATVFLDSSAHLTEAANRVVAARIADLVAPLLREPAPEGR